MTLAPEFSRGLDIARLPPPASEQRIAASAQERAALAARFGLLALDRLEARFTARAEEGAVIVSGMLDADVVQACAISAAPVPAHVTAPLELRFEAPSGPAPTELELDPDALDTLPLDAGRADVGEAVAQSLLLALDPYPRADAATLDRARRHLMSEEDAEALAAAARTNPFARLFGS